MWWLPALIGGALSITGNLVGRARRKAATEEAIAQGAENLREGQTLTAQNAAGLAQDNAYVIALSGVSAQEGTASQVSQQIELQKKATINKMSRDFDNYVVNLRNADTADAINTGFSVASEVFATAGRLYYDKVRVDANKGFTVEPPKMLADPATKPPTFGPPLASDRLQNNLLQKAT